MALDYDTRLQYLQAMGIEIWLPKNLPVTHIAMPLDEQQTDYACLSDVVVTHEPDLLNTASLADAHVQNTVNLTHDHWDKLADDVKNCTRCDLCKTRKNTVFGSGNLQAEWLLIGEAPGQSEDEQGLPFVGNAGLLLTEMLRAMGVDREEVFIANILKCRPPNNRDPKPEEAEQCNEYLQRQFALIKPKIILAVGRIAAQTLLNTQAPIGQLRGKVHTFNHTPVIVVYHPSYLLRSPLEKRKAWIDLQFALHTFKTVKG